MQYTYEVLYMVNIYAHSCVHIGVFCCSPFTIERSCCLSSPIFLLITPKIYPLSHGYRILVVLLPNILFSSLLTNYRSLLTAHRSQDSTPLQPLVHWSRGAMFACSNFRVVQSRCVGMHYPTPFGLIGWQFCNVSLWKRVVCLNHRCEPLGKDDDETPMAEVAHEDVTLYLKSCAYSIPLLDFGTLLDIKTYGFVYSIPTYLLHFGTSIYLYTLPQCKHWWTMRLEA